MGSASSKVASQCARPVDRATKSIDEKYPLSNVRGTDTSLSVPKSGNGSIQLANVDAWETTAAADPKIQLARTILAHSNIKTALTSREAQIAIPHVFNTEVELKTGPVTNQKSSGRCWLFATTNVIRYEVMKKLKLSDFQCSQVRKCLLRIARAFLRRYFDSHTSSSGTSSTSPTTTLNYLSRTLTFRSTTDSSTSLQMTSSATVVNGTWS